jgi:hypothetical protein
MIKEGMTDNLLEALGKILNLASAPSSDPTATLKRIREIALRAMPRQDGD